VTHRGRGKAVAVAKETIQVFVDYASWYLPFTKDVTGLNQLHQRD